MSKTDERFALGSPISLIAEKEPWEFTREDLINVILKKQIQRITFHYTAIDGKLKELRLPVENRRQVELILSEGERVDGSSIFKGIIDAGNSDLYVVPEYKTAFLNPFDEGSLDFICRFFNSDGELARFTPDNILHRASDLFKKNTNLELHALGELEFFLLFNPENNDYPLKKQQGYHASSPFVKTGHIVNEMINHITQITGDVKYAHHEVGYLNRVDSDYAEINGKKAEQLEIEFLLTPIEDTGNKIALSRWIIRNVAFRHNAIATFVPKLEVGHAGNGMHFHTALFENGKNIMTNKNGELSKQALMLIGGLCHYAPSLTAFGNMVSASYLRLVPNQEAPTKVCWSERNRQALIRVPLGWTNINNLAKKLNPQQQSDLQDINCRQTVELRSPDGSANGHLLLAGIAMAADWGLTNEKESLDIAERSHILGNVHASPAYSELAELATSCVESSEKLLQHKNGYEREGIFPREVINYVTTLLQSENDRNLNNRLLALPDDEKLKESRRIMHKDLHRH